MKNDKIQMTIKINVSFINIFLHRKYIYARPLHNQNAPKGVSKKISETNLFANSTIDTPKRGLTSRQPLRNDVNKARNIIVLRKCNTQHTTPKLSTTHRYKSPYHIPF